MPNGFKRFKLRFTGLMARLSVYLVVYTLLAFRPNASRLLFVFDPVPQKPRHSAQVWAICAPATAQDAITLKNDMRPSRLRVQSQGAPAWKYQKGKGEAR